MSNGTLDTYIHISPGHDMSHCRGQQDTKLLETADTLKLRGIIKVEELANCDIKLLSVRFGKVGLWLKQAAHGLDFSEIEESEEAVKSISRSSTFKENTNDPIK
jgi:DNA polymerase IV (archaeal DinB-like DNA polymerase)